MRRAILVVLGVAAAASAGAQTKPTPGLVISRSTTLAAGTYHVSPAPGDSAVIVVRGSDITLDLSGVELRGSPVAADPDRGAGIAILVEGGSNVTIRNGRLRGYRFAIVARGTRNLRILDNDLSYNWKPRLYSTVEHESLADWLSFHQNDKEEWMRFGAAIYLRDVRSGEIRGNTARQGMNALLMTRTDSLLVWNNDFSFNSGLGIGLYRSDDNRIMHNRVDYDVRGYSEGFYRRGQDSAGILIYEQSDRNVVAFNSVTHGGDGLFLWAGQHTMDTGEGGSNDNLFFENDFSWAPTNGMEATFSRNYFIRNRVVGNDHGLWGGYSFSSVISGNRFERNRIGIAIEHGQDNVIAANRFEGDTTHVFLWANPVEPGDWVYPKKRDTRSRNYLIARNTMRGARTALRIHQTSDVVARMNTIVADSALVARDTVNVDFDPAGRAPAAVEPWPLPTVVKPVPLGGGDRVLPGAYAEWPRSTIVVDDWGPYDWRSPKLWPVDSSRSTPLRLRVLGPPGEGRWRLVRATGATISRREGRVGDTIVVTPAAGAVEHWTVALEYRGQATVSPRGVARAAGEPNEFSYGRFDARATWDVKVFAWHDSTHPLTAPAAFRALLRGERGAPVLTRSEPRLDLMWYRPRIAGWPPEKYGVVATTVVNLPPIRGGLAPAQSAGDSAALNDYTLRVISDDGVRVYVDDSLVIEDWSVHGSQVREAPLSAGRHRLRVEYFQGDGWAELSLAIVPRRSN